MNMKRINISMPESTHMQLKLTATQQGMTMTEYVLRLINEQLKKDEEEKTEK